MESLLELRLLTALATGAAPVHLAAQRLRRPVDDDVYATMRRLERRGCVLRLRDAQYRLTRSGRARLEGELAVERLVGALWTIRHTPVTVSDTVTGV